MADAMDPGVATMLLDGVRELVDREATDTRSQLEQTAKALRSGGIACPSEYEVVTAVMALIADRNMWRAAEKSLRAHKTPRVCDRCEGPVVMTCKHCRETYTTTPEATAEARIRELEREVATLKLERDR